MSTEDFVIENSEVGPTLVCRVCDWWEDTETQSLADLIKAAKLHVCRGTK